MAEKQKKNCNRCSEPDLAWGKDKEGKFILMKGAMVNGAWTATSEVHVCGGEKKDGSASTVTGPASLAGYVTLQCPVCSFKLLGLKQDIIGGTNPPGYPICGKCSEFMTFTDAAAPKPARAADVTPETLSI